MYRFHEQEVVENYKRQAALQGIDFGENLSPEAAAQSPGKKQNLMKFGKPEDYKNLSKAEKKDLTAQMKGLHESLYSGSPLGKTQPKGR
jgi:hypothetical protein